MRIVMELDSLDELRAVFAPDGSISESDGRAILHIAKIDEQYARIKELESDLAAVVRVAFVFAKLVPKGKSLMGLADKDANTYNRIKREMGL